MGRVASYVELYKSGELERRAEAAWAILSACTLCPHNCLIDRSTSRRSFCYSGMRAKVASHVLHSWEEPPLTGTRGAGTIFFSNCSLKCTYCQNFALSQRSHGQEVSNERLAEMMLELQKQGAHNIDLVTPTHYIPQILKALVIAAGQGLSIPLVYNTSGYESLPIIKMLDGIVDIYLPDAKYADDQAAWATSRAREYVRNNRETLKEMYRQVGDLVLDEEGVAERGLIIRHLVMPNNHSQTYDVLKWIAEEISPNVTLSLMDQYFPAFKALNDPTLNRKPTWEEYEVGLNALDEFGFDNGWVQDHITDDEAEELDSA
jgi:putative pyruvate formate lyase activating enzyme